MYYVTPRIILKMMGLTLSTECSFEKKSENFSIGRL